MVQCGTVRSGTVRHPPFVLDRGRTCSHAGRSGRRSPGIGDPAGIERSCRDRPGARFAGTQAGRATGSGRRPVHPVPSPPPFGAVSPSGAGGPGCSPATVGAPVSSCAPEGALTAGRVGHRLHIRRNHSDIEATTLTTLTPPPTLPRPAYHGTGALAFSTKGEYGVRLMVQLARHYRDRAGQPRRDRRRGRPPASLSRAARRQPARRRASSSARAALMAATSWHGRRRRSR